MATDEFFGDSTGSFGIFGKEKATRIVVREVVINNEVQNKEDQITDDSDKQESVDISTDQDKDLDIKDNNLDQPV